MFFALSLGFGAVLALELLLLQSSWATAFYVATDRSTRWLTAMEMLSQQPGSELSALSGRVSEHSPNDLRCPGLMAVMVVWHAFLKLTERHTEKHVDSCTHEEHLGVPRSSYGRLAERQIYLMPNILFPSVKSPGTYPRGGVTMSTD